MIRILNAVSIPNRKFVKLVSWHFRFTCGFKNKGKSALEELEPQTHRETPALLLMSRSPVAKDSGYDPGVLVVTAREQYLSLHSY
jgi:hypothetical protein